MSDQKIELAMISGYKEAVNYGPLDVGQAPVPPTEWENVPFESKGLDLWYSVSLVEDASAVATLGTGGEDDIRGFMQIDINIPVKTGKGKLLEKAGIFRSYFTAGRHLTYDGVTATIISVGVSPAREVDNWYRLSVSVYYYSRLTR